MYEIRAASIRLRASFRSFYALRDMEHKQRISKASVQHLHVAVIEFNNTAVSQSVFIATSLGISILAPPGCLLVLAVVTKFVA